MAFALLSSIFSCCFPKKRRHESFLDESSRLIPQILEPPTNQIVSAGHQRRQDRLNTIVRATEGKMVNVGSQIPFNLHNQVLPESGRTLSRSTSGSLDIYHNNRSAHDPYQQLLHYPYPHPINFQEPSPTASPTSSPKRRPFSLQHSRSPSPAFGEFDGCKRTPILGLRLVTFEETRKSDHATNTDPISTNDTSRLDPQLNGRESDKSHDESQEETPRPRPTFSTPAQLQESIRITAERMNLHQVGSLTLNWGD